MELCLLVYCIALSKLALACWRFLMDRDGFHSNCVKFSRPQIQL